MCSGQEHYSEGEDASTNDNHVNKAAFAAGVAPPLIPLDND